MTKQQQYNLIFIKKVLSDGTTRRIVTNNSNSDNSYSALLFINNLHISEIQYFIDSISLINNDQVYDPDFYLQDGTEAIEITFNAPNFVIEGLTINMLDLQQLLQEWLTYLNS